MAVPIVTIDKGMFPDIPPYVTTRTPCSDAKIEGSPMIINYRWVNTLDQSTGYVPGNASFVKADGSPVILLQGEVTTHITGGGPVLGE